MLSVIYFIHVRLLLFCLLPFEIIIVIVVIPIHIAFSKRKAKELTNILLLLTSCAIVNCDLRTNANRTNQESKNQQLLKY